MRNKSIILFASFLFLLSKALPQAACQGALGAPVVNINFGFGANPGQALPQQVPGATTSYTYRAVTGTPPALVFDGEYSIVNQIPNNNAWFAGATDHTGNANGYMAFFNASPNVGVFYQQTVTGLCSGTTYEFAAWIANAIRNVQGTNYATPDVTFRIYNGNDVNLTNPLTTFATNAITATAQFTWNRYQTLFTMPPGVNSVIITLSNTVAGGLQNPGNDLAIDDITFRPCGPATTASFSQNAVVTNAEVCSGTDVNLFGSVGGGLNNPAMQWQISNDNGVTWTNIPNGNTANITQTGLSTGTYLFHLISAEAGNIGSVNCQFISNTITLSVVNCCSDECFWKLTGNNIIGNNNIFGTLTNNDVRIKTNGTDRGVIKSNGRFGWNTTVPSAFLHVNCNGGNTGLLSDVRFEGLENGTGNIVVIDNNGYLHNSQQQIVQNPSECTWDILNTNNLVMGYPGACKTGYTGIGTNSNNLISATNNNGAGKLNVSNTDNLEEGSEWQVGTVSVSGLRRSLNSTKRVGIVGYGNGMSRSIGVYGIARKICLAETNVVNANIGVYGGPAFTANTDCNLPFHFYGGYFAGQMVSGQQSIIISDLTLKENISDLDAERADDIINRLNPKLYSFKQYQEPGFAFDDRKHFGLISQEVEEVVPDLVKEVPGPLRYNAETDEMEANKITYKGVAYEELIAVLIKAVQNQNKKIAELQNQVNNCCSLYKPAANTIESKMPDQKVILDNNTQQVVLFQNVPNPFSEKTTIRYQIPPGTTEAVIKFYDMTGVLIKSTPVINRGEGYIEVFGKGVSTGVYSYVLFIDGKVTASKKMIKQ